MARYGWLRPGDVPNDTDSDDDEEEMDVAPQGEQPPQYFAPKISLDQYEVQKREFTKAALDNLINSAEYQRRLHTCGSCWSNWLLDQCTQTCMECGGYPMKRPCPICRGKCQKEWVRDVDMSHSMFEAHWEGECGLPPEEKEAFMYETFLADAGEDEMLEGLEDLSSS